LQLNEYLLRKENFDMKERRYPCEAKFKKGVWDRIDKRFTGLAEPESFTVLESSRYRGCICGNGHLIELPDGYPEPPERYGTWIVQQKYIEFI